MIGIVAAMQYAAGGFDFLDVAGCVAAIGGMFLLAALFGGDVD